jgi:hypothetical protein
VRLEGLGKMKNFDDFIGKRTNLEAPQMLNIKVEARTTHREGVPQTREEEKQKTCKTRP